MNSVSDRELVNPKVVDEGLSQERALIVGERAESLGYRKNQVLARVVFEKQELWIRTCGDERVSRALIADRGFVP